MSNIEELREHARILTNLMVDPHPGLSTWREAQVTCCREIGEFGGCGTLAAIPLLLEVCGNIIKHNPEIPRIELLAAAVRKVAGTC